MTRTWYAEDSSGIHWLDHTLYDKCPECMKGRLPHVWALLLKAQPMWMVCVRVVLGTLAFVGIIIIVFAIAPGRKRHVADFDGDTGREEHVDMNAFWIGLALFIMGSVANSIFLCHHCEYIRLWKDLWCATCSRWDARRIQEWENRIRDLHNRHRWGEEPLPRPRRTISETVIVMVAPVGVCTNENTYEFESKCY
eukprot:GEMP01049445.1.p1 GENE.GEMP01049445.1~~GEMP01049445.1.p1  ORF type:complete len:195 (+),score=31.26 GEMP01049445.1:149-733(+)